MWLENFMDNVDRLVKLPFYWLGGVLVIATFPLWFPIHVGATMRVRLRKSKWLEPLQWY